MRYTTPSLDSVEISPAIFTIETRYFPATDTKGSLVKASLPNVDGRQVTTFSVSVSYHATGGDPHDNAAQQWFFKFHGNYSQLHISPWADKPNKIKLLKVATKTGFLYTLIK